MQPYKCINKNIDNIFTYTVSEYSIDNEDHFVVFSANIPIDTALWCNRYWLNGACLIFNHFIFLTVNCRPLSEVRVASIEDLTSTIYVNRGSNIDIDSCIDHCNDPVNSSYVLLHQNHHTGKLNIVSQHQDNKFTVSDVQFNTSGIYCTYKECAPKSKEQCCTRVVG